MSAIELRQISFSHKLMGRKIPILDRVDLTIHEGEMVAILGPSGSGKSTLLYILGCLLKADSGSYLIGNVDVQNLSADELASLRSQKLGFVFQQFHLLPRANLIQNLLLGARYNPVSAADPAALEQKAKDLLKSVGLEEHFDHKPNQLSGGQQQRAAIARALINKPEIILADEPTGNLDSQSAKQILGLLKEIKQQGKTVVIITHDSEVANFCDRTITVRDGKVTDSSAGLAPNKTTVNNLNFRSFAASPFSNWQNLKNDARTALQNLTRNKSRSILTMLGVTIGVSAVLSTITLGSYTKEKILQTYESLGVNKLIIRAYPKWNIRAKDVTGTKFEGVSKLNDIVPMRKIFTEIQLISPVINDWIKTVEFGGRSYDQAKIFGVNDEYFTITNRQFILGQGFTRYHNENNSRVCVIGYDVAKRLFDHLSPIGQILSITADERQYSCQVMGVMGSQTSNNEWSNPNQQILVPESFLAVVTSRWNKNPHEFQLQAKSGSALDDLSEKIKKFFFSKYGKSADVRVDSDQLLVAQMRKFLNLFTALLTGVALISLTVGGIGIANMMLVSVAERFKEIGLRKALGARNEEIRLQFLIESSILCSMAGITGVVAGIGGYHLVLYLASQLFKQVQFEWIFNGPAILISFLCIVTVGLLSGLIPAVRAEKLQVVEALRSE